MADVQSVAAVAASDQLGPHLRRRGLEAYVANQTLHAQEQHQGKILVDRFTPPPRFFKAFFTRPFLSFSSILAAVLKKSRVYPSITPSFQARAG